MQMDCRKGFRKNKIKVNKEFLEKVKTLASLCMPQNKIADFFEISEKHWYNLKNKHPELSPICDTGKAKTDAFVLGQLMNLIKKGDRASIFFYLKTQLGWNEKSIMEVVSQEKKEISLDIKDPVEFSRIYKEIMTAS